MPERRLVRKRPCNAKMSQLFAIAGRGVKSFAQTRFLRYDRRLAGGCWHVAGIDTT